MQVGSIVECVNGNFYRIPGSRKVKLPKEGKLYTVIGIEPHHLGVGVYIEECNDIIRVHYRDSGRVNLMLVPFHISRFREVLPPSEITIDEIVSEEAVL